MAKFTPMMEQYMKIKEQNQDCILFYRLGDFYEMFFDDALIASKVLEITLTGKNCGLEERAPMCGVPHHACDVYLNKLVENGYKVGICEQVEDPKAAKGIVKREVVRIVTPGTNISTQNMDETKNNYLMSVYFCDGEYGISFVDITTGDFRTTSMDDLSKLEDEIFKFTPAEIICNEAFLISGINFDYLKDKLGIAISTVENSYFEEENGIKLIQSQFRVTESDGMDIFDFPLCIVSTGALLCYLNDTQKHSLEHLTRVIPYVTSDFMLIDSASRRNLELCETMREKQKKGSLLWVLDKTKTAMGARLLRRYIEQPLVRKDAIEARFDAISALNHSVITREELREYLHPIYDMERLMTKVSYRSANPRDLIAFKSSLELLPSIKALLKDFDKGMLAEIYEELDPLEDLYELLEASIVEDPPIQIKEGGIIKNGYLEEIDQLKMAKTEGKQWLADLEERERETTGIRKLRIKYNKVFGYYIEVTNSFKNQVPEHYIRKQTLANSERYTTEELETLADTILGAEERLYTMEYDTYVEIREQIAAEMERVQKTANAIAKLDVMASFAYVAEQNGYVRPTLNKKGVIDIKDGRHPVVEKMITNDMFIANDTFLDNSKNRISIITGPNMAGKSTYMRQTALIVLMAQIGSFVPAKSARIGLVDRIFTRVGASDDLASGQSTFMVEMSEVANILKNATKHSLLILDEIGRGTSTFDGLSIAWAVVEYISNSKLLGAKTLFATHYHELTELEDQIPGVNNYCIAVKEQGDDIVFLRKIIKGGADKSYGIQVAKLAGVPEHVIQRAKEIAQQLTENDILNKSKKMDGYVENPQQLSFFDQIEPEHQPHPVILELRDVDLSHMTPIDAMNYLFELQERAKM
jgi:DNA mismatch repair protein MutS